MTCRRFCQATMNNACTSASHSELKPPETCKVLKPTCLQPWNRAVHVGQGQGNGSTIAPHFAFLKLNFNLTRRDVQPIETPVGPATLSFHREVGRGLHHNAPSLCAQSSQHLPRAVSDSCDQTMCSRGSKNKTVNGVARGVLASLNESRSLMM